jgi:hypothetical protein
VVKFKKIKYIEFLFLIFFLTACGGGAAGDHTGDHNSTVQINENHNIDQNRLYIITDFVTKDTREPTVADYKNLGISGVTPNNIDKINNYLKNLDSSQIDTKEKIQAVINSLNIDTRKPTITLINVNPLYLNQFDTFIDPGATAFDDEDGNITDKIKIISNVDTSKEGQYKVTYRVSDKAGNVSILTRTVIVKTVPVAKETHINEFLTSNAAINLDADFKTFSDWIELYNSESHIVDVGGFYLSDEETQVKKWRIPDGTRIAANGYLLVWADGKDKAAKALHTNFKLSQKGDSLILSDRSGHIVDKIVFGKQKSDISATKHNGKILYMDPTPGEPNAQGYEKSEKSKKPIFTKESGFYNGAQSIEIRSENGGEIYYTTDGSIPTKNSHKYTHPLDISKTTVVRARVLEKDKLFSSVKSRTYFIDENVYLPVMSVSIDEKYLFDNKFGIYVPGTDDNNKTYEADDYRHLNYRQDWVRPGHVEYLVNGKSKFSQNVGFKIHGNNTRSYPQKSLALYAKEKYGSKSIDYPLFKDKPFIKKVKSFVLRNGGTDWGRTLINDGIEHRIVKDMMDIDYQSFSDSVVVFINGKYWGIHNIREKMNSDYLAANHGVDPKKIDLLANKLAYEDDIKSGDDKTYKALIAYIDTHDLSNDLFYNEVVSKIDLDEYINYIITESFMGNSSIHHNIKYWREKSSTAKWRWLLFDLDRGFRFSETGVLQYVADDDKTSMIFRNLLKNQNFIHKFASRYFTHLNTTFQTIRMDSFIKEASERISPEVSHHFQRWSKDKSGNPVSKDTWEMYIQRMYNFSRDRNSVVLNALRTEFQLTGAPVLNIHANSNGTVYIDNVALKGDFSGTYFTGAAVTLKAVPETGYRFVKWSDGNFARSRELIINGNITVNPVFEAYSTPKIVIHEINYASAKTHDSGDWIELYNNDSVAVDISGWHIKDDRDENVFTIPPNTILQPGDYIVLVEKQTDFQKFFPNVLNIIGDLPFGLGKNGDSIRLYNKQDMLVDSITYDNRNWPDANANGKTLVLNTPQIDNSNPSNWHLGDNFGTPGR